MIIEKSMDPSWLSNTWLVADRPGGHGVLIDTGGPADPILAKIRELDLTVEHLLCTHHHYDHVANNARYASELGAQVYGHPAEEELFGHLDVRLEDGAELTAGELRIRALHIPGHTCGQLAFVVNDERVFTGDTLFKGSVGGTRGPGHTTFEDLRRSIMDVLLKLPHAYPVHPGHTEPTTLGAEWEQNAFVRLWRGLDPEGTGRCTVAGQEATLILEAPDYDGGTKCWVRFADGTDDLVGGSRVSKG